MEKKEHDANVPQTNEWLSLKDNMKGKKEFLMMSSLNEGVNEKAFLKTERLFHINFLPRKSERRRRMDL